jgi:hypothetical protein
LPADLRSQLEIPEGTRRRDGSCRPGPSVDAVERRRPTSRASAR